MRICFLTVEIFAWGAFGGFGSLTRLIGRKLVERGHEVFAIVPRREGQKPIENLNGIIVYSFKKNNWFDAKCLSKKINADIYHSEEPSVSTVMAQYGAPGKKHIVTFQDPRNLLDYWIEFKNYSLKHKLFFPCSFLFERNIFITRAIQKCSKTFVQANFVSEKAKKMYRLNEMPEFLPNPVERPNVPIVKAENPTVCFLARLDRRKRPEIFLDLAAKFENVDFFCLGASSDKAWDTYLRDKYKDIPNITMMGFVDPFNNETRNAILSKSWILINTAERECLPVSFLEAAIHKCAILSNNNPDNFAIRGGYHAHNDDFEIGLQWLLENDRWTDLGSAGAKYVEQNHVLDKAIDKHIESYNSVLERDT